MGGAAAPPELQQGQLPHTRLPQQSGVLSGVQYAFMSFGSVDRYDYYVLVDSGAQATIMSQVRIIMLFWMGIQCW